MKSDEKNQKTEEKQSGSVSRRKALKGLLASGGAVAAGVTAPAKWVKPVVERVLVPAHAQTSQPEPGTIEGAVISRGPNNNRPSRVCYVSDPGEYNIAPVAYGFSPDPGAGRPFTATLSINGSVIDTGSGVTDVDGDTFAYIRFKGTAAGIAPGNPVSFTFNVEGYHPVSGSSCLNDCTNCSLDAHGNPDNATCSPQTVCSE